MRHLQLSDHRSRAAWACDNFCKTFTPRQVFVCKVCAVYIVSSPHAAVAKNVCHKTVLQAEDAVDVGATLMPALTDF